MPIPRGYTEKRGMRRGACAKGSIRTVRSGSARVLICCPKGKWNARRSRCRVGTRAYAVLKRK